MSKIAIAVGVVAVLFLGPLFAWDIVRDYRRATQDEIDRTKPATVKIAQAERQMEEGTEALGRTRAELARIEEERTRLEELLAQAPMPLDEMETRHEELRALIAEAEQTGGRIEHAGRVATPAEMRLVATRQRAVIRSFRRYEQAVGKLEGLRTNLEGLVVRARQERATTKTDLEYARTLTRISRTVTRYSSLSGLDGGAGLFGSAHDTLRDVIAVQETWLEVDEPATPEGQPLFSHAVVRQE